MTELETLSARIAELERDVAARDLVIKQLQHTIENHSGNYKLTKSECAEINRVVELQPTTAALDSHVAERIAKLEKDYQARLDLVTHERNNLLETTQSYMTEIERLRTWIEGDARCPCCETIAECVDGARLQTIAQMNMNE